MDLTSLGLLVAMVFGILGMDTALNPTTVLLEVSVPSKLENAVIDQDIVSAILAGEVSRISATPSIVSAPEIRVGATKGVAMAIAESLKLQSVVLALQSQLGLVPEQLKLALMTEGNVNKIVVSGSGQGGRVKTPPFEAVVSQRKGETILDLVHRASIVGLSRIDPYFTALHLLQKNAAGKDFTDVDELVAATIAALPPTPVNQDRALFENLQGIVWLFKAKPDQALAAFNKAIASDPDGIAQVLNAGFVEIQMDRYKDADRRMRQFIETNPPRDRVLLGTAYMIWAGAHVGMKDFHGANAKLAHAVATNPDSSLALALWSEIKAEQGQKDEAVALHQRALEASGSFENYAEVAALYFQLAWRDGQPLTRSQFTNPGTVRLLD